MNHQAERDRRAKAYSYRAYREAVRGVVVTICFLVALFADSWVEWLL